MSTEKSTFCWLLLYAPNTSLELLDSGMEGGVGPTTPFGGVCGVHDGRVVAPEEFADLGVGRPRESTAEVHGQLARYGHLLRPTAGPKLARANCEPIAHRA